MRKIKFFEKIILFWFCAIIVSCIQETKEEVLVVEQSNTQLTLRNLTKDSVLTYLTLSGYADSLAPKYAQNVNGIFGCTQSGLVGWFYLGANDSVSYTSDKRFSANISFGAQPLNCPDSTWATGVNLFEFNLNVPQESIDISAVGGVNCLLEVILTNGANWQASPKYPNVRSFYNDSMYKNSNLIGVFPYGCTNCTNTEGKQACQTPAETPDSVAICNPTRSANERGGTVTVSFKGYTNYQICNQR